MSQSSIIPSYDLLSPCSGEDFTITYPFPQMNPDSNPLDSEFTPAGGNLTTWNVSPSLTNISGFSVDSGYISDDRYAPVDQSAVVSKSTCTSNKSCINTGLNRASQNSQQTYSRCLCGAKYQRAENLVRHIRFCKKTHRQPEYLCSCTASYLPTAKDLFEQHILGCSKKAPHQHSNSNHDHDRKVLQHESTTPATAGQGLLPSLKAPTSEAEVASPFVAMSYWGGPQSEITQDPRQIPVRSLSNPLERNSTSPAGDMDNHSLADVVGELEKHQSFSSLDGTLSPSHLAKSSTKVWIEDLKAPEALKSGSMSTVSSGSGSPAEYYSVATDSDLLSISDTSDPGLCFDTRPLPPIQQRILDHILRDYQAITRSHNGGDSYVTPEASASSLSTRSNSQSSLGKRKPSDQEFTEGFDNGPSPKAAKRAKEDGIRLKVLACPFWKQDWEKHRLCCKLTLRRIRDVKQHLHRRHTPEMYCDRCLEVFEDTDRYDIHLQSNVACFRTPGSRLEGITTMQSRAISKKSDRNLGEEEQWFTIWGILFPGAARPASAYVESELTEEMNSFQEYWTNRGHDVLMDELNRNGVWSFSSEEREAQGRQILARGLNAIYEQWVGLRRNASTTPPSSSTSISPALTGPVANLRSPISDGQGNLISDIMPSVQIDTITANQPVVGFAARVDRRVEEAGSSADHSQSASQTLQTTTYETSPLPSGGTLQYYTTIEGEQTDIGQSSFADFFALNAAMSTDFEFQ